MLDRYRNLICITKTDIQELKEEERIIQLAKIASDSTSDHALLAAKELYEKAQTK